MGLKEWAYSVLAVSASENFNSVLSALLSESRYSPVCTAASVSAAKRILAERAYDYVIINSPLPDDAGAQFAIDACNSRETVVLLMVRSEFYSGVYDKVAEHGVFVLSKPTSKSMMATALSWMASARERLRKTEEKTLSIEDKMEEIRIVNRAKWLLIGELKMEEPEAHRYIVKQAMDRCLPKRKIAQEIIHTYHSCSLRDQ